MGFKKAIMNSTIAAVFSALFLIIIITMIFTVVLPWINYGMFDSCYAKFASDTGKLTTGIMMYGYKNETLDFGKCSSGLFIFNNEKSEFKEIERLTTSISKTWKEQSNSWDVDLTEQILGDCDEDAKSYLVITPWFDEYPNVGNPWYWILGGAVAGAFGAGHVPFLSKNTYFKLLGAAAVGYWAGDQRTEFQNFLKSMEERNRRSICYSYSMPFDLTGIKIIPEIPAENIAKQNIEAQVGKHCVLMFRGKTKYYIWSSKEGTCTQHAEDVNAEIKRIQGLETSK